MNEDQLHLASLPINLGGLGIRRVEDIFLPAFLSSVNAVSGLVHSFMSVTGVNDLSWICGYRESLEAWTEINSHNIPSDPTLQKNWDFINTSRITSNMQFQSDLDKARFLASISPVSGAWLNTIPCQNLGTFLNNNSFRIAVGLRLGCDLCEPHFCICGEKVDSKGIHGLSCCKSVGRYSRHFEINNLIQRALSTAQIPSTLEPVGLFRNDGKRVDGVTLIPWSHGTHLVWDATCSDTIAPSHVGTSSKSTGGVAELAAIKKRNKYKEIVEKGYQFLPFAVETLGPWCQEASKFMQVLGKRLKDVTGEPRSKSYLIQKISLAIQRGNSTSVMGTLPSISEVEEIYFI